MKPYTVARIRSSTGYHTPSVSNDATVSQERLNLQPFEEDFVLAALSMGSESDLMMERKLQEGEDSRTEEAKPVKISVSMIARRNLPPSVISVGSEQLVNKLLKLTHIRLDRERIGEIDHMEVLGPITNLYLQQNCIGKIENLESLTDLRFLVLCGNQIKAVENLMLLDKLKFLDLSDNFITDLDPEEFPKSLMILNLAGNPCCLKQGYRLDVIKSLPNLNQLDGEMVNNRERREAGNSVASESDEGSSDDGGIGDEDEETDGESYHKTLEDVLRLSADLITKSKDRTKQYISTHDTKMATIDEIRSQSRQEMASAQSDITPR